MMHICKIKGTKRWLKQLKVGTIKKVIQSESNVIIESVHARSHHNMPSCARLEWKLISDVLDSMGSTIIGRPVSFPCLADPPHWWSYITSDWLIIGRPFQVCRVHCTSMHIWQERDDKDSGYTFRLCELNSNK